MTVLAITNTEIVGLAVIFLLLTALIWARRGVGWLRKRHENKDS